MLATYPEESRKVPGLEWNGLTLVLYQILIRPRMELERTWNELEMDTILTLYEPGTDQSWTHYELDKDSLGTNPGLIRNVYQVRRELLQNVRKIVVFTQCLETDFEGKLVYG